MQAAAQAIGQQLVVVDVSSERDIEAAFATFVQRGAGALFVGAGPFLIPIGSELSRWRRAMRMPTSFRQREFAEAGGLMSYGASHDRAYRQAGIYAGRILKGEKPADLPVHAGHQVRVRHQPQDRQGARPGIPSAASRHRRRGDRMRRRDFIAGLGGAAALPFAARAQQAMPVIGFMQQRRPAPMRHISGRHSARAWRKRASSRARTCRSNIRWAEGQYDRLPALAADLVRRRSAVIVATAATLPALAAKAATTTIPIVFTDRQRSGQGRASSRASTGRAATSPA